VAQMPTCRTKFPTRVDCKNCVELGKVGKVIGMIFKKKNQHFHLLLSWQYRLFFSLYNSIFLLMWQLDNLLEKYTSIWYKA
jgi:hypothetical protein